MTDQSQPKPANGDDRNGGVWGVAKRIVGTFAMRPELLILLLLGAAFLYVVREGVGERRKMDHDTMVLDRQLINKLTDHLATCIVPKPESR